jgi:seryl-tRNA synthetase
MLDINKIRSNPEEVRQALKKRNVDVDFTQLLQWDQKRRSIIAESEELKARKNKVSSEIPVLKKSGQDVSGLMAEMKEISDTVKGMEEDLRNVEASINDFLARLPNIPADDVIPGGKENNQVVKSFGKKPEFDFQPKNHVDLVTSLGLIDYERGVKIGGSGFWVYTGDGALLEWSLLNYFIEEHTRTDTSSCCRRIS